jgi:hypothetical protein
LVSKRCSISGFSFPQLRPTPMPTPIGLLSISVQFLASPEQHPTRCQAQCMKQGRPPDSPFCSGHGAHHRPKRWRGTPGHGPTASSLPGPQPLSSVSRRRSTLRSPTAAG